MLQHFFILFLLLSTLVGAQEKSNYITKIDFERNVAGENLKAEEFATYSELKTWAIYQGWDLDPDGFYGGIQNGICKMISPGGWEHIFFHQEDTKSSVYLILDITRYTPSRKQILRPQVLRIYINGREKEVIEIVGRKNFQNPVQIPLDPSDFPDGRIHLRLEPASPYNLGKFWGLWDAHISRYPVP
jgi:hypothetical protein